MRANAWHSKSRRGPAAGFSLVEVLIALSVMGIALVALLELQVISIAATGRAEQLSRAVLLANAKMADALADGVPEIGSQHGWAASEDGTAAFRWQVDVEDAQADKLQEVGISGLRSVRVRVTWTEGRRQQHVEIVTYAAGGRAL